MAHRVPISIRLNSFEGPLDLLLYLIQSHELDISKISISKITDQYLAYVSLMQELNFDIASDFLVMAATLIQWKSKALLPQENADGTAVSAEDGEMSQEELLRQLLEHQRFLAAGEDLGRLTLLGEDTFTRPNHRPPTEKIWKTMEITDLAMTFQDLLVRERKRTTILKKETVSLATKITHFADRLQLGKIVGMSTLIDEMKSRPEVVVTFLASLELSRLKKMRLHQEGTYQEIYVELLESIQGFNTQLATGFDNIAETVDSAASSARAAADAGDIDAARAADAGVLAMVRDTTDHSAFGSETAAADLGGGSEVSSGGTASLLDSAPRPAFDERAASDSADNRATYAGPSSKRDAKRAAREASREAARAAKRGGASLGNDATRTAAAGATSAGALSGDAFGGPSGPDAGIRELHENELTAGVDGDSVGAENLGIDGSSFAGSAGTADADAGARDSDETLATRAPARTSEAGHAADFDLHFFGDDRGPKLADVLAGTDDGVRKTDTGTASSESARNLGDGNTAARDLADDHSGARN